MVAKVLRPIRTFLILNVQQREIMAVVIFMWAKVNFLPLHEDRRFWQKTGFKNNSNKPKKTLLIKPIMAELAGRLPENGAWSC